MVSVVHQITTTIPFLEFSTQFQSNNFIYDKGYSKTTTSNLLSNHTLKRRRIRIYENSRKLNQCGIKTHRGKQWFNTSVSSALKRKHERDVLFDEMRNRNYPAKISKTILSLLRFNHESGYLTVFTGKINNCT